MANFFNEVRRNKLRSGVIMFFFAVFVLAIGAFIGYYYASGASYGWLGGIVIAFVVAGIYLLISWFRGHKMVLSTMGAKPVKKKDYPHLYHTVEGLALAAGIPTPQAYIIEDKAPNAFATGRDPQHSVICVTTGLLERLNRQELEGVIAHEMSHIKNYDIRVMLFSAVLVGVLTLISDFIIRSFIFGAGGQKREGNQATVVLIIVGLVLAILAPIIGQLIKLSISRKREYLADASGAMLTRYPPGLASALRKISQTPTSLKKANKATAHLFIANPFKKKGSSKQSSWWSTHPPIEKRIARLEAM